MLSLRCKTPSEQSGAEIAIDVLNELGVEYLFSHTGGAIIPLHAELNLRMRWGRKAPRFVLFRQEGGAGTPPRATPEPAVGLDGVGHSGRAPPIWSPHRRRLQRLGAPRVHHRAVPSTMLGKDAFQEVDMGGLPAHHQAQLPDQGCHRTGRRVAPSLFVAGSGRPGPVVVDICKNAPVGCATDQRQARPCAVIAREPP